ncbi:MAG: hypothetical protein LBG99_03130 [Propionibacteriaceae bacterium]|jgi:hypothetical protein|nr:hypothetical protein [Propionibacteriaceae bacterium]
MKWHQALSVGLVASLSMGLVGLAVASEGMPVATVDMNDSGVWVTNHSIQHLGRFNHSAGQIDGISYVTEVTDFDVIQDRTSVFVTGPDDGSFVQVNPPNLTLGIQQLLGSSTQVSLGGEMVGILVPEQGKFWMIPVSSVAGFDPNTEVFPPIVEDLPHNAVSSVGFDGTGYVVDPLTSTLITVWGGGYLRS